MVLEGIPNALGSGTAQSLAGGAQNFLGNPTLLAIGIVLIIGAVLVLVFLKKFLVNSALGIVAWAILNYVLNVQLPLWASLIVSVLFGLAGIGAMLVLRFLGIV